MHKPIDSYFSQTSQIRILTRIEQDSVWLTLAQIADLFGCESRTISNEILNIFKEGELQRQQVIEYFLTPAPDGKRYHAEHYNLDVIISVGYRLQSIEGTRFRHWAYQQLKTYWQDSVRSEPYHSPQYEINFPKTEIPSIFELIKRYHRSFELLKYTEQPQFDVDPKQHANVLTSLERDDALDAIQQLKTHLLENQQATENFGVQIDHHFERILNDVSQMFGNNYVYSSIEKQAAHLLYAIIKSKPFVEGNKRIGALMFLWFLSKNQYALYKDGQVKFNNNALFSLIAWLDRTDEHEKAAIIQILTYLLNQESLPIQIKT